MTATTGSTVLGSYQCIFGCLCVNKRICLTGAASKRQAVCAVLAAFLPGSLGMDVIAGGQWRRKEGLEEGKETQWEGEDPTSKAKAAVLLALRRAKSGEVRLGEVWSPLRDL